jgi:hypothetical protein
MAAERLFMRKLRAVIRLRPQCRKSGRAIAKSGGVPPSTAIAMTVLFVVTIPTA